MTFKEKEYNQMNEEYYRMNVRQYARVNNISESVAAYKLNRILSDLWTAKEVEKHFELKKKKKPGILTQLKKVAFPMATAFLTLMAAAVVFFKITGVEDYSFMDGQGSLTAYFFGTMLGYWCCWVTSILSPVFMDEAK